MFCDSCGKEISDRAVICPNCGASTRNFKTTGNQQTHSAGVPAKRVSKIAYVLLAIFLGGLGIHYFYAGKTGAGVLCLLFCWTGIPAIIAFVVGLCALGKTSDSEGKIFIA